MSRGLLNWLITIPADGSLPIDGVAPTLIEWHTKSHPAHLLANRDCSLLRLDGFHPQSERVQKALISLGLQNALVVNPLPHGEIPYLVAQIETPLGLLTLGGRPSKLRPHSVPASGALSVDTRPTGSPPGSPSGAVGDDG
jgi:hypothetical protein